MKHVTVVYATDDSFCKILGVSLFSLFSNNQSVSFDIYILATDVSSKNMEILDRICDNFHQHEIYWVNSAEYLSKFSTKRMNTDRGSMSQYTRLLIGSILPTNVIKVLYLDCDTLILGNVLKIWNLNLADKIIAALPDVFSPAYRRNIGLHRESIMFNSGVMLIDLRHWRENNTEAKLLEVIDVYHGRVQQGDQGVLNAVLSNEVVALDPRDNSISLFFDFSYEEMLILRKPLSTFTQEELNMAINHPRIVHFTTSFASTRPWYLGPASQKYSAIWRDYYSQTEWANEPLEEKKISFLKKIMMMIYSGLPREIAIRIAGLSHAIFRPGVTRLKQFFLR